jgi:Na+/H+ antiporter NhaD/arsenite permease-like protein
VETADFTWFADVVPFSAILLGIALIPLVWRNWWHSNLNKLLFSLACALPSATLQLFHGGTAASVLLHSMHEYFAFIVLLLALYVIGGGIRIEGDLKAIPLVNTVILAVGSVLASFIGTTGASMLLIRLLIDTNSERKRTVHTFVFFIFLVSNIGGCLLPIGDPPLFIGFLKGVPFWWTLNLAPYWLFAVMSLLAVYYLIDLYNYSRELPGDIFRDDMAGTGLKFGGLHNLPLLLGVIATVVVFQDWDNGLLLALYREPVLLQEPVLLLIATVSYAVDRLSDLKARKEKATRRSPRTANGFDFHPIVEVGVLFLGIFICMAPVLETLRASGERFLQAGLAAPAHFFWMTGILSSFLDNAPTYAAFFVLGSGINVGGTMVHPGISESILIAVSLGSVFMGALTYIGNGPNFMVKAICEKHGVKMPGFIGYLKYSLLLLLPLFTAVSFLL